jgi:hypothetical protein
MQRERRWRAVIVAAAALPLMIPGAVLAAQVTPLAAQSARAAVSPEPGTPAAAVISYHGHLIPAPQLGTIPRNYDHIRPMPGSPSPTAYDEYYAGYAVTADDEMMGYRVDDITKVAGTLTVPAIDCAASVMGTSGTAFVDDWVGIDGYGNNVVEQTGIEAYCTGPAGGHGTAGPYYYAWYDTCCEVSLTFYPDQPALHAGNTLQFSVQDVTSTGCCEEYEFTFTDVSDSNHTITATQQCPGGPDPCLDATGEVITEDPGGGAPAYVLPSWDSTYGNYSDISVEGQYTSPTGQIETVDGTLNTEGSYWVSSGPISMNYMGTLTFPYNITGPPYGDPQSLNSEGTAFDAYCVNYTSDDDYSYCPG